MMVRKGLMKVMLGIATLALALVAAMPVSAWAANTEPTDFWFNFNLNDLIGTTDHTYARSKVTNMPAYANASGYSTSMAIVVGIAGINGYTLDYTNRTINSYAYFRNVNQASSIRNTVNENYENIAWFWVYKTQYVPQTGPLYVAGEWAPDAYATYYVINNDYNE